MRKNKRPESSLSVPGWVWPAGLVLLVLAFFWRAFTSDQVLMAQDSSVAYFGQTKASLPQAYLMFWNSSHWLGMAINSPDTPGYWLLWLLPLETFVRLIYPLHVLAVALLGYAWFRRMEMNEFGAFFGALVLAFSGPYLTYIYPGHIGKFEMTTLATLAFMFAARGLQSPRWTDFAWSGVALGGAVTGAADTGAFMALLLAAWFLYSIAWRWAAATETLRRGWAIGFTLLVVMAGVSALPMVSGLAHAGVGAAMPGSEQGDGEQRRWNWATQWSYPPDETMDLFAPGYHGWKSHDPQAPYWGALGRDPQFDPFPTPAALLQAAKINDTGRAAQALTFWNFRLNSDFLGSVTLLAILLGIVALFVRGPAGDDEDWREQWRRRFLPMTIFWLVVVVIGMLVAFGRHFPPPFRLLQSLPLFGSMRNPNKALTVVMPAIAVLAAIGMDRLWRETEKRPE